MVAREDVLKYLRYATDKKSFRPERTWPAPSQRAFQAARALRGAERDPALIIHAIMPRSGSVFVGELLRLHPALWAYPYDIWEFPFLQRADDVHLLQRRFLLSYEQNVGKIGEGDFLPLFASSLMAFVHQAAPPGKRVLLKVPSVQYLHAFWDAFPHEQLLLLVRDGRDVVHSTLKTWPQLRFSMVCLRWRRAAEMVLAVREQFSERASCYWLARFEDAVADPRAFVSSACEKFGLVLAEYPMEAIDSIPVRGSSSLGQRGRVSWQPAEKPEGYSPTGHWHSWSAWRKGVFKRIAGKPLEELGYCDGQDW